MRLIDADDVLDSIENWKRKVLYYHPHTKKFSTIPLSEVLSFLGDSPTIDAVPVKHGEWVDGKRMSLDGTFYWFRECSLCGYEREDDNEEKDTNYCPKCGARMDGGEDDE